MIYEGTNEIQAIDLLVRKVLSDGGAALCDLLQQLGTGLPEDCAADRTLNAQITTLGEVTQKLVDASSTDRELPFWVAQDYLRAVALTLLSWAWLQIRLGLASDPQDTHAARWHHPAAALEHWILPEFAMRVQIIKARLA
jgi:hypothetical protein